MKSDGVDAWLKHWLKLQKKNKRPLVLKGPADRTPEVVPKSNNVSKRKAGKGKARYIDSDDSDDVDDEDKSDDGKPNETTPEPSTHPTGRNDEAESDAKILPPSPLSASKTRKTRRTFLESLSNDENYQKLLLLLYVAKVSKRH
jgi:hypothetical protein